MTYHAWFDASIKEYSITISYVIVSSNNRRVREVAYKVNNTRVKNSMDAENYALLELLNYIDKLHLDKVDIVGDNKNLIDAVNMNKSLDIYQLEKTKNMYYKMSGVSITWRRRCYNWYADLLSKTAHYYKVNACGGKIKIG